MIFQYTTFGEIMTVTAITLWSDKCFKPFHRAACDALNAIIQVYDTEVPNMGILRQYGTLSSIPFIVINKLLHRAFAGRRVVIAIRSSAANPFKKTGQNKTGKLNWKGYQRLQSRCHLNGLAMKDGKPAYVTAVSESDAADGWRDFRRDGGVVIDVEANEIITRGLSMPHSPRWHQDKLWLHNSGTGEFGTIELKSGKFEPVAFCPGYLRGLCFMGDFAIVGLSKPRDNRTFTGLALDDALADKKIEARCALQVINLKSGDVVHWLRIEGVVEELYDVVALPGAKRPMAVGIMSDEIRRIISIGDDQS